MASNKEQVAELLYQALETEKGGVLVYETALRCVVNDELKEEWEKYLEQTQTHLQIVEGLFEQFGLDPDTETPGLLVLLHIGESLDPAVEMAVAQEDGAGRADGRRSVVEAETKDHLNWELISRWPRVSRVPRSTR